jgi:hypothetical protein
VVCLNGILLGVGLTMAVLNLHPAATGFGCGLIGMVISFFIEEICNALQDISHTIKRK